MAPQPDAFAGFPPLPAITAQWAPVYLEPLPGSGERITVGVVAYAGPDKEHHVLPTLREAAARCMYGEHASQIVGLAGLALADLESHFKNGVGLNDWNPALRSSISLGPISTGYGDSAEDVARSGAQLASSLYWSKPIRDSSAPDHDAAPDPDADEWIRQIKNATIAMRQEFGVRFLKRISLTAKAPPTRIGYYGSRLAAQFGRLVPGRGLSLSQNRAKAYLTDLQILRDNERKSDIAPRPYYELLLWTPPAGSPQYSADQHEEAQGAFKELEGFGDLHDLRVEAMHTAEAARARILHAEEA